MTDTAAYTPIAPRARSVVQKALQFCFGACLITLCLQVGIKIQHSAGLPIPGNVIGMALLLVSLETGLIKDAWIQRPCTWLLILLPALFVPIYVVPISDPTFWLRYGSTLVPAAILGVIITLGLTGWLAFRTHRQ